MILGFLILMFFAVTFSRVFAIIKILLNASNTIHRKLVYNILRTKADFFDKNSMGKIMTRFTKDMVIFDNIIPFKFSILSVGIFRILSIFIIMIVIDIWLLVPVLICSSLMVYFSNKYQSFLIYLKK